MKRLILFLGILIVLFSIASFAQETNVAKNTDCEQILIQADDEFNAGRFYGLPALLKPCLDNGNFSNEQQVRAYLLLTQAYLILDDPIAADDSYLKLLRADPEYVANTARDPIDVYYLSKKFTSVPIFTPHLRIGLNTSFPRTIYDISTSGASLDTKNILKIGFQVGGGVDWNLDNHWSICAEGNYSYKAFKRETNGFFDADEQVIVEKQNWFDIPMYLKYSDDSGRIRPFGYAGFAINLLLSSRGPDWLLKNNSSDGSSKEETGPSEVLTSKRNSINRSLVLGGGAKYKIGKDFIYADVRYMAGISNLTNPENNYYLKDGSFDPSILRYVEVGDLFTLDNLSLSFGYIHPIYNPRKKSKPRFSNLFKKKSEAKIEKP
ncbi:MAG: porin family protein [Cyclobacteriaceae bacterium]